VENFGNQENEALEADPKEIRIAGRLMTRRVMGKAAFAHVRDQSGDLQIYAQRGTRPEGIYNDVFKKLDIGALVGVSLWF
jgi:Lysyl-tRNA synthetase (class II)